MKKAILALALAGLLASCDKNEEQVSDFDKAIAEKLKTIDKSKIKPELGEIKPDPTQIGVATEFTQGADTTVTINW